MDLTLKEIKKIKKKIELNSLVMFFEQLKDVSVMPTGNKSDKLYKEFFNFVKKVDKLIELK